MMMFNKKRTSTRPPPAAMNFVVTSNDWDDDDSRTTLAAIGIALVGAYVVYFVIRSAVSGGIQQIIDRGLYLVTYKSASELPAAVE